MSNHPLASFLTFRTYGSWLHGDARGSMDRLHRTYGCRPLAPDDALHARRHASLQQSAVVLDGMQRQIVEATLAEVCEYRRWKLYAANARTNHVHAVVEALAAPERMLVDFKAYSTRRLAERGLAPGERVWNRHGSTRYLWCVAAVEAACHYVEHMQDEPREGTLGDPRLPSVADPWSEGCHAGGHEQVVPPV